MARIAGVNISDNKQLWIGLTGIYGIGLVSTWIAKLLERVEDQLPRKSI